MPEFFRLPFRKNPDKQPGEASASPSIEKGEKSGNDVALRGLLEKIPNVASAAFINHSDKGRESISLENLKFMYSKLDRLFDDELMKLDKINLTKEDRNKFIEKYLDEVRHLRRLVGTNNKGVYAQYAVFEESLKNLEERSIARIIQ